MESQAEPREKLNPNLLDVVKTDAGGTIYYAGKPLTTPKGLEASHESLRLLEHILRELSLTRELDWGGINSYSLFSLQKDLLENLETSLDESFEKIYAGDPIIMGSKATAGEEAGEGLNDILDFFEKRGLAFSFLFGGVHSLLQGVNKFILEFTECSEGAGLMDPAGRLKVFHKVWSGLPLEKKTGVVVLGQAHKMGVILPLLAVLRRITPAEYANGVLVMHLPHQKGRLAGPGWHDVLTGERCVRTSFPDWEKPEASFAAIREQVNMVLEYMTYFDGQGARDLSVPELIKNGEGFALEFKSTLRWNLKAEKKDPNIEHASLKTIAAFLNSAGGTLLIGVRDDGSIEGIETDGFPDEDRFSLHFWNLIKSSLGVDVSALLRTYFETVDGRLVFVVQCAMSPKPVFLNQKGFEEEYFIRVGPSSAKLGIGEALKYIDGRFGGK
ncbi:MAG: ATP-binding protein [Pseudomonadota bacterium]